MSLGMLGNPGGGGDSIFAGDQGKAMEASLKEFLSRPENQAAVERHQRKEIKQALQLQEKMQALHFRDKVLESEYEAQKAVAPFLENKVLRRIVQTFANDPHGDFSKWALNPAVIEMLRVAKLKLDKGYLNEADVEEILIRQLEDPSNPAHEDFKRKTRQVVRLPTDQLVEALNEHLTERRQGNEHYRAGEYTKALHHYQRAAGVVEFVVALSGADQREIDSNKVLVYCNLAATYMAMQEYGAAIGYCDRALETDPRCAKALLRRIKARIARHDYDATETDIALLRELDPWGADVAEQSQALARAKAQDRRKEAATFANMFDRQRGAGKGAGRAGGL